MGARESACLSDYEQVALPDHRDTQRPQLLQAAHALEIAIRQLTATVLFIKLDIEHL